MRALKTLLIILLAVVVLVVILGLLGPKHAHLERKTVVAAPVGMVWNHVKTLKAQNEWSPFLAMDHGAIVTYDGAEGELGSKSAWEGKESGKGEQVVALLDPGKRIGMDLHFIEPFDAKAKSAIALTPMGDSTEVAWSFDSENGFVSRIISVFKDMDAMMGPVFADGLATLKGMSEADAAKQAADLKSRTYRGYTIETVDLAAVTYLGKRQTVKWNELGGYFGKTFPAVAEAAGKAGLSMEGHPSALIFKWDTVGRTADVFAGIPVKAEEAKEVDGFKLQLVPAGKVLAVPYYGNYDQSEKAHYAIGDKLKADGLELRDAVIEEYVTDPTTEPDTAKWLTKIYYPIK